MSTYGMTMACSLLWERLSKTPINDKGEIEKDFHIFSKGTCRFEIWHWFEDKFDVRIIDLLEKA
jgi:hypothetical protein